MRETAHHLTYPSRRRTADLTRGRPHPPPRISSSNAATAAEAAESLKWAIRRDRPARGGALTHGKWSPGPRHAGWLILILIYAGGEASLMLRGVFGDVIGLIQEIAEQTNSARPSNATIEAARAGRGRQGSLRSLAARGENLADQDRESDAGNQPSRSVRSRARPADAVSNIEQIAGINERGERAHYLDRCSCPKSRAASTGEITRNVQTLRPIEPGRSRVISRASRPRPARPINPPTRCCILPMRRAEETQKNCAARSTPSSKRVSAA